MDDAVRSAVTVACVLYRDRQNTTYNADYVARLQSMFRRHAQGDYRFVCFSNVDVPCDSIPLTCRLRGWWAKLETCNPNVLEGRVLVVDLDTVLIDDITSFLSQSKTTMIGGFHGRRTPFGSGFMMLTEEDRTSLWREFNLNPHAHMNNYRGDQDFISPRVQHAETWQERFPGQLVSYKLDCVAKHGGEAPARARVVCFHGKPRPADLPLSHWIYEHWK